MNEPFRAGYVAIVGRPNVGKSTLMNHLIGQKLSITSRKPQTTRHRIIGIQTLAAGQLIYVDTPGIHRQGRKAMNRYLNRTAALSLDGVDLILFVVEAGQWQEDDQQVLGYLQQQSQPVIAVVNKIDQLPRREALLPLLEQLTQRGEFIEVVPVAALKQTNLERLQQRVLSYLPLSEPIYPDDQLTDRSERFLAAEIVREKLTRQLGNELPYALTVEIEQFTIDKGLLRIAALIWVEREGQKRIIIGKGGERLKLVGAQARADMEQLFGHKIYLQLWVKIKQGWSDSERLLGQLGYGEP